MVDALRAAHAALVTGGLLIDIRPYSRARARIERRSGASWRAVAEVTTRAQARARDRDADRAIRRVAAERLLRPLAAGTFDVRVGEGDLDALLAQLAASSRFSRVIWRGGEPRDRAVRYSLLRPLQYGVYAAAR